jgi:DnaJ-class molecular chaperone
MLVCGVCKGKKLIKDSSGKNILCPKCNGSGNLEESKNNTLLGFLQVLQFLKYRVQ